MKHQGYLRIEGSKFVIAEGAEMTYPRYVSSHLSSKLILYNCYFEGKSYIEILNNHRIGLITIEVINVINFN